MSLALQFCVCAFLVSADVAKASAPPEAASAAEASAPAEAAAPEKWEAAVLGLDGKIYGIPSYAPGVLCVDPLARTAEVFGDLGTATWNQIAFTGLFGQTARSGLYDFDPTRPDHPIPSQMIPK